MSGPPSVPQPIEDDGGALALSPQSGDKGKKRHRHRRHHHHHHHHHRRRHHRHSPNAADATGGKGAGSGTVGASQRGHSGGGSKATGSNNAKAVKRSKDRRAKKRTTVTLDAVLKEAPRHELTITGSATPGVATLRLAADPELLLSAPSPPPPPPPPGGAGGGGASNDHDHDHGHAHDDAHGGGGNDRDRDAARGDDAHARNSTPTPSERVRGVGGAKRADDAADDEVEKVARRVREDIDRRLLARVGSGAGAAGNTEFVLAVARVRSFR